MKRGARFLHLSGSAYTGEGRIVQPSSWITGKTGCEHPRLPLKLPVVIKFLLPVALFGLLQVSE